MKIIPPISFMNTDKVLYNNYDDKIFNNTDIQLYVNGTNKYKYYILDNFIYLWMCEDMTLCCNYTNINVVCYHEGKLIKNKTCYTEYGKYIFISYFGNVRELPTIYDENTSSEIILKLIKLCVISFELNNKSGGPRTNIPMKMGILEKYSNNYDNIIKYGDYLTDIYIVGTNEKEMIKRLLPKNFILNLKNVYKIVTEFFDPKIYFTKFVLIFTYSGKLIIYNNNFASKITARDEIIIEKGLYLYFGEDEMVDRIRIEDTNTPMRQYDVDVVKTWKLSEYSVLAWRYFDYFSDFNFMKDKKKEDLKINNRAIKFVDAMKDDADKITKTSINKILKN